VTSTILYIPFDYSLYEVYYAPPIIRRILRYRDNDVGVEVRMEELPLELWEKVIERCRNE